VDEQFTTVMIRNFDRALWAKVRQEALNRRWDTAPMVEHIVREWLAAQERRTESMAAAG